MTRKITFNFDDKTLAALDRLQEASGKNLAKTLADAIGFYDWAYRQSLEGVGLATINKKDQPLRAIILPFSKPQETS